VDALGSLAGLSVNVEDDFADGLGGLSLGEDFDGEATGTPKDDEEAATVDAVKKTVRRSNKGRRVSVDPDGYDGDSLPPLLGHPSSRRRAARQRRRTRSP
jgi:hypothetical protein